MPHKPDNSANFATASLEQWAKAAAKSAPGGDVSALFGVPFSVTVTVDAPVEQDTP